MARRRTLRGHPLLVATAGLAITVGCNAPESSASPPPPPGNLMPPPTMTGEVCVDTVPESAIVAVNGAVIEPRCTTVSDYEGANVTVHVSAAGYVDKEQIVPLTPKVELQVTLNAEPPMPTGNLMPPPPPPPVGNLVVPPPIEPPK